VVVVVVGAAVVVVVVVVVGAAVVVVVVVGAAVVVVVVVVVGAAVVVVVVGAAVVVVVVGAAVVVVVVGATGVTHACAEESEFTPYGVSRATVKQYCVPLDRPVTVIELQGEEHVPDTAPAVARYVPELFLPRYVDSVNDTVA
jgi:hypothetical protein